MNVAVTYRADGRADTIRRADGSLYWSFDRGLAPAPEPQPRYDSVDWTLPDGRSTSRADAADTREPAPASKVASSAELRQRLGVRDPAPPPRRAPVGVRHDAAAAGFVTSSAQLRSALGRPEPLKPRYASFAEVVAPPAETVRHDASQPPRFPDPFVRSSAELRARIGLPRW